MTAATQDHRRKPRQTAAWRKDDVRKAVEGAIAGGMPVGRIRFSRGGFELYAQDDSGLSDDEAHCARLMEEAFGEGGGD